MAPYDWLSDEDVEPDELDYRNQIRDSVVNGDIQARPLDNGDWHFAAPNEDLPRTLGVPSYRVLDTPTTPSVDAPDAQKSTDAAAQGTPDPEYNPEPSLGARAQMEHDRIQGMLDAGSINQEQADHAFKQSAIALATKAPEDTQAGNSLRQQAIDMGSYDNRNLPVAQRLQKQAGDVGASVGGAVAGGIGAGLDVATQGSQAVGDALTSATGNTPNAPTDFSFQKTLKPVGAYIGQTTAEQFVPATDAELAAFPAMMLAPGIGPVPGTASFLKTAGEKGLLEALGEAFGAAGAEGVSELGPGTTLRAAMGSPLNDNKVTDTVTLMMKGRQIVNDIMKTGVATIDTGISPEQARLLKVSYDAVNNAKPDALVTVYHVTDPASAVDIGTNGLKRGGFLTTDPEVAMLHTTDKGVEDPNLITFQIPRNQITQSKANPSVFTSLTKLQPFMNDAINGWVANPAQTVKDWIGGAMNAAASESGHFLIPGSDTPIPDDVAKLAFGDDAVQGFGRPEIRDGATTYSFPQAGDATTSTWHDINVNLLNQGIETGRLPDAVVAMRYDEARQAAGKAQNVLDNIAQGIDPNKDSKALEDALNQGSPYSFDNGEQMVPKSDKDGKYWELQFPGGQTTTYDTIDQAVHGAGGYGLIGESTGVNYERVLTALADAQKYGEEMYRRSGGKDGMVPKIQNAIKQMLVSDEGAVHLGEGLSDMLESVKNLGSGPNRYQSLPAPPTHTARLTGIGVIDPHLSPIQRALNVTRNILEPVVKGDTTVSLLGYWDDPLISNLTKESDAGIQRMMSLRTSTTAQVDQITKSAFTFAKDGVTVTDKNIPGLYNNLPDIAANLRAFWPMLSAPQKTAMTTLQRLLEPYDKAVIEQGLVDTEHLRSDIQDGGFYLPRGDHPRDTERTVVRPTSRAIKKGAEKPITFPTQAHGLEWAATNGGTPYVPFTQSFDNYMKDMGSRVLDKHLANVLTNAKDESGRLLVTTPQARLLQQEPKLVAQISRIKKDLSSLQGSIDTMDAGAKAAMTKFIYTPAPDLDELRNALASFTTKGGKIRSIPTYSPGSPEMDWKVIRKSIREEVFQNRGTYAGMTGEEARKSAVQTLLDNRQISRGKFKGLSPDEASNLLEKIKGTAASLAPDWNAALKKASMPGAGEVSIETKGPLLGKELSGVSFPDALGSDLNEYIKNNIPTTGKFSQGIRAYNASTNLLRELRSTWDFSYMQIQGLLGAYRDPVSYAHANLLAAKSMFDKDHGEQVLGAYFNDFDTRAAAREAGITRQEWPAGAQHPRVQDWAMAGAHLNGVHTEYTEGGLGNLPVFKQADRGFGYFGDVLRLDGMQRDLDRMVRKDPSILTDPATLKDTMGKIASVHNGLTGWSPNRLFGSVGGLLTFAPRMYMSQLETLAKAVAGNTIEREIARDALVHLVGTGVAITAAANYAGGHDVGNPEFDWWSPMKNGRYNSNFMRIRSPKSVLGVNVPGGQIDGSLFGPWDSLVSGMVGLGVSGDPTFLARSKANPLLGLFADVITGKDAVGNKVDTSLSLHNNMWRQFVPFSVANVGKESALQTVTQLGGNKESPLSPTEAMDNFRRAAIKSKISDGTIPPDQAKWYSGDLQSLGAAEHKQVDAWVKELHPDDFAHYQQSRAKADTVYYRASDAADKATSLIDVDRDKQLKELLNGASPKAVWDADTNSRNQLVGAKKEIYGDSTSKSINYGKREDGTPKGAGYFGPLKRSDGSVSTEISVGVTINGKEVEVPTLVPTLSGSEKSWLLTHDVSDPSKIPPAIIQKAEDYAQKRISAGKSPFAASNESPKDSSGKGVVQPNAQAKEFQDAVAKLSPNDIRFQEAAYNAITTKAYTQKGGIMTSDDFDALGAAKSVFLQKLYDASPDLAMRLVNSISLQEQQSMDNGHPMDKLRKSAATALQPYYDMVSAKAPADQQAQWLNANPDADILHWLTAKTDAPTLHSVDAVQRAITSVPKRPATFSGGSTVIDESNLHVAQQYDKQITQLITLSHKEVDANGNSTDPITKLRQGDPLYDALYFWLGFASPTKDLGVDTWKNRNADTVPVYHIAAVEDYIRQWGGRTDGATPRRAN